MKPAPSIRSRLVSTLVGLSLAWAVLASAAVWFTLRHEVDELLDDTLATSAEVLVGLLPAADELSADGIWVPAPTPGTSDDNRYAWQWVDPAGHLRARSPVAPGAAWVGEPRIGYGHSLGDGRAWRLYGHRLDDGSILYVAQSRAERLEALAEVAVNVIASALLVGLVFALWLRWRLQRELQPLTDLSAAVARHDPLSDAVLPDPNRLELHPLREAVDALGKGLRRRLAQERAVAAQVAHALRTPLAGLDAQLAAAQVAVPADQPAALQRAREASRQLRRVVTGVISLFRSGSEVRRQPVDVGKLLDGLPVEGLAVTCPRGARLSADPDLLAAALSNLLDNALRQGASRVDVEVHSDPQGQALRLHDNGPGLPAAQRAALQDALDTQSYEGHVGLGLMLADLVARAHGGRLVLEPVASGFAVRLDLGPPA